MLIESDQGCQIADINFFLVMVADVGDCGFYGLDPAVIRFFSLGKKLAAGKFCENFQQGSLDQKLICQADNGISGGAE